MPFPWTSERGLEVLYYNFWQVGAEPQHEARWLVGTEFSDMRFVKEFGRIKITLLPAQEGKPKRRVPVVRYAEALDICIDRYDNYHSTLSFVLRIKTIKLSCLCIADLANMFFVLLLSALESVASWGITAEYSRWSGLTTFVNVGENPQAVRVALDLTTSATVFWKDVCPPFVNCLEGPLQEVETIRIGNLNPFPVRMQYQKPIPRDSMKHMDVAGIFGLGYRKALGAQVI